MFSQFYKKVIRIFSRLAIKRVQLISYIIKMTSSFSDRAVTWAGLSNWSPNALNALRTISMTKVTDYVTCLEQMYETLSLLISLFTLYLIIQNLSISIY